MGDSAAVLFLQAQGRIIGVGRRRHRPRRFGGRPSGHEPGSVGTFRAIAGAQRAGRCGADSGADDIGGRDGPGVCDGCLSPLGQAAADSEGTLCIPGHGRPVTHWAGLRLIPVLLARVPSLMSCFAYTSMRYCAFQWRSNVFFVGGARWTSTAVIAVVTAVADSPTIRFFASAAFLASAVTVYRLVWLCINSPVLFNSQLEGAADGGDLDLVPRHHRLSTYEAREGHA